MRKSVYAERMADMLRFLIKGVRETHLRIRNILKE